MDKLRAMETFVRIVDRGTLTAAADSMRISLPSVVRTLAALERLVGVRLLHRTTRRISLTDEGREYYERCGRILAATHEAEAALSARRLAPRGFMRVTAPVMFGRLHLAPLVAPFLERHPALQVELLLLDRVIDVVEEGVDVALRIGHLGDSTLVAIGVGETRRVVCASPGYLRAAGTPRTPADLSSHRCVDFTGLAAGGEWPFGAGRAARRIAVRPVLASNQIDVVLVACVRGLGLAQLLGYQVQSLLEAKRLVRVLRAFETPAMPIHLVYASGRLLSTNVRAFVDWMVPRLRERVAPGRERS